jgi:hypothetical protein
VVVLGSAVGRRLGQFFGGRIGGSCPNPLPDRDSSRLQEDPARLDFGQQFRTPGETVTGGPYTISATLSPAAVLSNYAITANTARLAVNPAGLTVTANDATRYYGLANPAFSVRYSGFVFVEGPNVLGGTLSFRTLAVPGIRPHPARLRNEAKHNSSSRAF